MKGVKIIEDDKIGLKTAEKDDMEFLRNTKMMEGVEEEMGYRYPSNMKEMEDGFEKRSENESFIEFIITKNGKRAGQIAASLELEDGNAGFGLYINPDFQGEGVGTKASKMMIDYLFKNFPVKRIEASYLEGNIGSKRMQEKLGFKQGSRQREWIYHGGKYRDHISTRVLREEWEG